jgi:DNA polymerase phi
LSRIDTVTCSQIVALIVESSKTHGSMTGQEERDVLFARLFGFTAVIQSGLLVRTQPLRSSTPSSDLSTFQEVLDGLIALGGKKSWLRESAWWTIALMVDVLKESNVSWKGPAVLTMTEKIFLENKTWSPEKVALALKLQRLDPNQNWTEFVAPVFKNSDLLSGGNLSNLARILKVIIIRLSFLLYLIHNFYPGVYRREW